MCSGAGYFLQVRRTDGALIRPDRAGLAMALVAPMDLMGPGSFRISPGQAGRLPRAVADLHG